MAKPGATVLIVFHLLDCRNLAKNKFTAEQVFEFYKDETATSKGKERVNNILVCFKKRRDKGPLWAFQNSANLASWLKLHYDGKPRYWFEFDGIRFCFKYEYVNELECWLSEC